MRVLVVDDSTIFRKAVRDALSELPQVEIVGVAANGRVAIEKIERLKPDLLTLDVEMPELDGIGVLRELRSLSQAPGAIMLSSLTESGARMTTRALELGAFDFILKPAGNDLASNAEQLRVDLLPRVTAFQATMSAGSKPRVKTIRPTQVPSPKLELRPQVCVVGVSTGGPAALKQILPTLPEAFPVPIVVVQHMPAVFTRKLAEGLDNSCALAVREAEGGMSVRPGNIYIVPGGKQTRIVHGIPFAKFEVTDDPPINHCKPSINLLFEHAAQVYGGRTLAVILTGMGDDGTEGCRVLRSAGATVIAQESSSCVVYGMPRSVVEAGLANLIKPLHEIGDTIDIAVMGQPQCS